MTRRVIIDTDPGQDDALALLVALASPELDVVAVTTVAGNVPQPLVTDNALALVELAGASDVPVYRGVSVRCSGSCTQPSMCMGRQASTAPTYPLHQHHRPKGTLSTPSLRRVSMRDLTESRCVHSDR